MKNRESYVHHLNELERKIGCFNPTLEQNELWEEIFSMVRAIKHAIRDGEPLGEPYDEPID